MKNFDVPDIDNDAVYYIVDSLAWYEDARQSLQVIGGPYQGIRAAKEAFRKYAQAWEDDADVEIDVPRGFIGMDEGETYHSVHIAGSSMHERHR